MTTLEVFRVFDDEWQDIMGSEQLREFATLQILNNFDGENDDDLAYYIENYIEEEKQEEVKKLIKEMFNNYKVELTTEQATELLKIRLFDVEKLDVH